MNELEQSGFLLVDKPRDWTSFDVVAYLRGVTKIKKIGHTGTLDPFATGLLIVAVGREATKRIDEFKGMNKVYIAEIVLGATSDTQDSEGTITHNSDNITQPSQEHVLAMLQDFTGNIEQIPPMYSAKKVKGKKLYELARKGIEIERKPHPVTIHSLELLEYSYPTISLRANVSTGTYIRTLAADIGEALGTGAYCNELKRVSIGDYFVDDALCPKEFSSETWASRLLRL